MWNCHVEFYFLMNRLFTFYIKGNVHFVITLHRIDFKVTIATYKVIKRDWDYEWWMDLHDLQDFILFIVMGRI